MDGHTYPSMDVPAPRAPVEANDSALDGLVQFRHRVALALARKYINPPGRPTLSERAGALLDHEAL